MSTAILPPINQPPPDAVLSPTPAEIDESIAQYEQAKRHAAVAKIALDEEKQRLVFLVNSFGAAHANASKRLEGALHTVTVTEGIGTKIVDTRVLDLQLYLTQMGCSQLFAKLFTVVTRHKLVEDAEDYLRTVDLAARAYKRLQEMFHLCFSTETNSPSVKVELRQPAKPVKKAKSGKAGA